MTLNEKDQAGWKKGCYNIKYDSSKLNRILEKQSQLDKEGPFPGNG